MNNLKFLLGLLVFTTNIIAFAQQNENAVLHLKREYAFSKQSSSSPLLTYHNGPLLIANKTQAIFWGSAWNSASFAGDKITGLDNFFNGFGGSKYSGTSTEYYNAVNMFITNSSTYLGHVIDTSTPPSRAARVSTIVSEACKIANNNPDPNALYVVYTSTSAGNVNYCAWHSWGNCSNGAQIQVAYMPNLDGVAGCDPQDTASGNSKGLAALANVTAHELSETITDPRGTGWLDSSGAEDGDKCAWSFPPGNGLSTLANGYSFKLQMEWSNMAFTNNTGLPNLNGQNGCIYQ